MVDVVKEFLMFYLKTKNDKNKELRIGNKVSVNKGFEMEVVSLFYDVAYLNFEGNEGDVWEEKENDLQPIPIDDKIIKKWWRNRKNKNDDLVLSVTINSKKIHLVVEDKYYIRCDYLHQLQNAYFILTGKELQPVSDT